MTTETLYIVIVATIVIMVLGYFFKYRFKKNPKKMQYIKGGNTDKVEVAKLDAKRAEVE